LANGRITASGLFDPKEIVVGDFWYCQLAHVNPRCELCENNDMIPFEERFWNSPYKPPTTPMPLWRYVVSKFMRRFNRLFDLWEQRRMARETMPK
jgi:hypothetical protein